MFSVEKRVQICRQKGIEEAKKEAGKKRQEEEPKSWPSSKIPWQTPISSSSKPSAVRPLSFEASTAANLLKSKASPPQVSKVEVDILDKVGLSDPKPVNMSSAPQHNRDNQYPLQTTQEQSVIEEDWDLIERFWLF